MKKILILSIIIVGLALTSHSLLATSLQDGLQDNLSATGGRAYYGLAGEEPKITSPTELVGNIIYSVLTLLGVWFVILIIWSGFQWMKAGGNSETVGKAKQRIINATIGLVIILFALTITTFIMDQIGTASGYGDATQ
jgi:heme/copper-type cytochrome/quinol oxidase subunit 2